MADNLKGNRLAALIAAALTVLLVVAAIGALLAGTVLRRLLSELQSFYAS